MSNSIPSRLRGRPDRRAAGLVGGIGLAILAIGLIFGSFGGFSQTALMSLGLINVMAAAGILIAPSRATRVAAIVVASFGALLGALTLTDSVAFLLDPSAGLVSFEVGLLAVPARLVLVAAYLIALVDLIRGWPSAGHQPQTHQTGATR